MQNIFNFHEVQNLSFVIFSLIFYNYLTFFSLFTIIQMYGTKMFTIAVEKNLCKKFRSCIKIINAQNFFYNRKIILKKLKTLDCE